MARKRVKTVKNQGSYHANPGGMGGATFGGELQEEVEGSGYGNAYQNDLVAVSFLCKLFSKSVVN